MVIDRFDNEERLTFTSGRTDNEGRGSMKVKALVVAAVVAAFLVVTGSAFAHGKQFSVTKACNAETGNYDLKWTVSADTLNLSPKISVSNRASIPVGSAVGASTVFMESVPGTTTSVSAQITVRWSDNFVQSGSAATEMDGKCKLPPPPPECPDGLTKIDYNAETGVLRCKETVTVTRDVPGPTVTVTVPGPPVPGPTVTVYVDKPIPGKTIVKVVKVKGKTKYVYRVKKRVVRVCPIKPVEPKLTG